MTDNGKVADRIVFKLLSFYVRMMCRSDLLIKTHLTLQEKILLMQLARKRRGQTYVEIGSYLGASACFISRGIRLTSGRSKARLYCVDTWMNDAMTEGKRDTYREFTENTHAYRDMVVPLRLRSEEAAVLAPNEIDFLFVDGDHSYERVVADIGAWFPKLSAGAVVVFHDYGWAEGVKKAVEEFVKPVELSPGCMFDNTYWTIVGS